MTETTPPSITEQIIDCCRKVCPDTEPVYVAVSPQSYAVTGRCFENIRNHIEKNGGNIQHGWTLWEMPNLLCTFEFHAVWVTDQDNFIDITPTADGESTILFLPDNQRRFLGKLIPNIRIPLADNEEVRSLMKLWDAAAAMYERLPCGERSVVRISQPVTVTKVGRNQPCPCGSRTKYKKCCGSPARADHMALGAR